jgi:hypothetical protein
MRENQIILDWRDVNHKSGRWADRWDYTIAIYGILHPAEDKILYVGKADGYTSTVRRRWGAADKHDRVWRRIEEERGLFEHGFIVGELRTPIGLRLTRELVCDIESLLIHRIQPWANRQNTKSRGYTRRGMSVFCQGHWRLKRKTYRDE